ncbi:MAG: response regulator transcription factor [Chloroflexota bacterium]
MPIRLLVADDHGLLRAGLVALLNAETGMVVVGEAEDEHSVVSLTVEKKPDIVLMDISMPDSGGIEATRRIKQLVPEAKILILTVHEDKGMMQEALRAGARGYILKRAIKSELVNAIHAVLRDELYLHPAMARLLFLETQSLQSEETRLTPEELTLREIEILRLIARGYTNGQTAEKLHISVRTVEYHRGNLTAKLNLRSRSELMRYAEEKRLV